MTVFDNFPPGLPGPTEGFSKDTQPRVNRAQFGDGYELDVPDGINFIRHVYQPEWRPLSRSQKDTLENFFIAHKGSIPFTWVSPDNNASVNVKARSWRIIDLPGPWFAVTATLEQTFNV